MTKRRCAHEQYNNVIALVLSETVSGAGEECNDGSVIQSCGASEWYASFTDITSL